MGRRIKIGMVILLIYVIGFAPMASVDAAEPLTVDVEGVNAEDNQLYIYLKHNMTQEEYSNKTIYKVTLNGESLPVTDVTSFAKTQEPCTYLCLVDVSGSMSEKSIEDIKEILNTLAKSIKATDNICIMALGNDIYSEDFVSDPHLIKGQINNITRLQEDTNLYYGITRGLDILTTSAKSHQKKSLIIFSDGMEDQVKGITREEVNTKIQAANVPIYTVAMLGEKPSGNKVEQAKIFGSFARLSPGGTHTTYIGQDSTNQQIAEKLEEDTSNGIILKADLREADVSNSQQYLEVDVEITDTAKAYDGYEFPVSLIASGIKKQDTEQVVSDPNNSTVVEQPQMVENDTTTGIPFVYIMLVIIASIGVLIYLIGSFMKKRFGKKNKEELEDIIAECLENEQEDTVVSGQSIVEEEKQALENETIEDEKIEEDSITPDEEEEKKENLEVKVEQEESCSTVQERASIVQESETGTTGITGLDSYLVVPVAKVTLTSVGLIEETIYEFKVQGEVVIGRNWNRCDFIISDDPLLSGVHCSMQYTGDKMIVTDLSSTNGTYVNGVPIVQPYDLQQDDIIMIGSRGYRLEYRRV